MVVNCQAPGNREKTVDVSRRINRNLRVNAVNGFIPGAAYDYFSRGAFGYPEEIEVSFLEEQVKPYELPEHQADDLGGFNHAHEYERIGPSIVVTEQNRYERGSVLGKRFQTNEVSSNPTNSGVTDMPPVTGNYNPAEEDK